MIQFQSIVNIYLLYKLCVVDMSGKNSRKQKRSVIKFVEPSLLKKEPEIPQKPRGTFSIIDLHSDFPTKNPLPKRYCNH